MKHIFLYILAIALMMGFQAQAQRQPAPTGAKIIWENPKNNATVTTPVKMNFYAENIEIGLPKEKKAHFHIMVDREDLVNVIKNDDPIKPGPQELPKDILPIMYFNNDGKLEYELPLSPGPHKLQIILVDHNHIGHFRAIISEQRTIFVKEATQPTPEVTKPKANYK